MYYTLNVITYIRVTRIDNGRPEREKSRGPKLQGGKQDGRQEFIDDFPAELEVDFRAVLWRHLFIFIAHYYSYSSITSPRLSFFLSRLL